MSQKALHEQAIMVASVLPKVMRRLFVLDVNDPGMDLPVAQLRVCSILREGPRTISALSRELGISVSATTQIADRLERADMVERVVGAGDRRVKSLQLTAHGAEVMRRRNERREHHVLEALERLSPEELQSVMKGLQVLLEASRSVVSESPNDIVIPETLVS